MLKTRGLGISRTRTLWILGQGGLIVLLVLIYFRVRGLTEGSTADALAHANDILARERRLGIDIESSVQGAAQRHEVVETIANWVYIWGHWPVIIATMLWLAARHRDVFRRLRDAMMMSGAVGMVIFATYPVAPPRLAHLGMVDTVTQKSDAYRVLQPPALVNQYAAMPSLHTGWDLLVGMAIVTAASGLVLRIIGVALPFLMATAVVLTANHYVVDVVAGIWLVLVAHIIALVLERRRFRRRSKLAETWVREWRLDKPPHAKGV